MLIDKNKKMSELLQIKESPIKIKCSLDCWYECFLHKKYSELILDDIVRMLMQNIGTAYAIPKAIEFLLVDPLCGLNDGHLLKLVCEQDINLIKSIFEVNNKLLLIKDKLKEEETLIYEEILTDEVKLMYNKIFSESEQILLELINKLNVKVEFE